MLSIWIIGPLKLGGDLITRKFFICVVNFNLLNLLILNSRLKPPLELITTNGSEPEFVVNNKKNIALIGIEVLWHLSCGLRNLIIIHSNSFLKQDKHLENKHIYLFNGFGECKSLLKYLPAGMRI